MPEKFRMDFVMVARSDDEDALHAFASALADVAKMAADRRLIFIDTATSAYKVEAAEKADRGDA